MILSGGISLAEEESESSYFKGVEYASQGKFEEAKKELETALKSDYYYPFAKLELHAVEDVLNKKISADTAIMAFKGKAYANKKMWGEAEAEYTNAIKSNPNYAYAFISRGNAYFANGLYDDAISDFSEALDVNPNYTEAYNNRGVAYEYKGRFNNAVTDFTKAIEADPKYAVLYYNRGLAYAYKGQYDRAIPDFNKAIELKPAYPAAYFNKAVACEKSGLKDEAIEGYEKFLTHDKSQDTEKHQRAEESIKLLRAPKEPQKD